MLPALAMGLEDSVPSPFMAPLHNRIREAYKAGDMSKAQQIQVNFHKKHGDGISKHKPQMPRNCRRVPCAKLISPRVSFLFEKKLKPRNPRKA